MNNEIYLNIFTLDWTMGDAYDFDIWVQEGCTWVVEWGMAVWTDAVVMGNGRGLYIIIHLRNMDIIFIFIRKTEWISWDSMLQATR